MAWVTSLVLTKLKMMVYTFQGKKQTDGFYLKLKSLAPVHLAGKYQMPDWKLVLSARRACFLNPDAVPSLTDEKLNHRTSQENQESPGACSHPGQVRTAATPSPVPAPPDDALCHGPPHTVITFGFPSKEVHEMRHFENEFWGTCVAQSVEPLTHDFGSGHGLRVGGSSPSWGSVLSTESAEDSFSHSAPPPQ